MNNKHSECPMRCDFVTPDSGWSARLRFTRSHLKGRMEGFIWSDLQVWTWFGLVDSSSSLQYTDRTVGHASVKINLKNFFSASETSEIMSENRKASLKVGFHFSSFVIRNNDINDIMIIVVLFKNVQCTRCKKSFKGTSAELPSFFLDALLY